MSFSDPRPGDGRTPRDRARTPSPAAPAHDLILAAELGAVRALCGCGWESPVRQAADPERRDRAWAAALQDADEHLQALR